MDSAEGSASDLPADPEARLPSDESTDYLSWTSLSVRMADSGRSDEGRRAGVWAIGELAEQLGEGWMLQVARSEGAAPMELLLSPFHAVAFGELLDLALRLHLLHDLEGMATVRRDLKRDLRKQRRLHTRVVLSVAALAMQSGYQVALEKRLAADLAPTDVVITLPSGQALVAEAFAVMTDQVMRQGMDYTDGLMQQIGRICWGNGVELDGHLEALLTDEATTEWLAEVAEAATLVGNDGAARVIAHPAGRVTVRSSADAAASGASFTGPIVTGKGSDRLGSILRRKAGQAAASGATWLCAEVFDGLWQFTQWAGWSLPAKGEAIASEVRQALLDIPGIVGVVLSCGPAMAQGDFVAESARLGGGGFVLRRVFAPFRVRETVILPLRAGHDWDSVAWTQLYDREPEWLDWALGKVNLPALSKVLAPRVEP